MLRTSHTRVQYVDRLPHPASPSSVLPHARPIPLAVTGTPGIGKSMFFYYCVARLMQSDNPPDFIVVEHMADPGVVVRLLLGAFRTF